MSPLAFTFFASQHAGALLQFATYRLRIISATLLVDDIRSHTFIYQKLFSR